jgi:hypothetical protein
MSQENEANLHEIERAAAILFEPGQVVEIRVPGKYGAISGYFDDHQKLAKAVKQLSDSGEHSSIYFTLNPCHEGLLARAGKNEMHEGVKDTTSDSEILRRRWLLVDLDPERPKGVSATKQELEAAWDSALRIIEELGALGWPEPVIARSGNGSHLLYRVDQPNDKDTALLFKSCLAAISEKFSTEGVEVDPKVYNASRITKAYGSRAAKGTSTKERPHRSSKIEYVPDPVEIVSREQLQGLAATVAVSKAKIDGDAGNARVISAARVEEFLAWAEIEVKSVGATPDGGTKWILTQCPFNPEHNANDPAVFLLPGGALGFKCFHTSCSENHWRQFRAHVEEKKGEEFPFTNRDGQHTVEVRGIDRCAPTIPPWPDPLSPAAYHGLAGELVRIIEPHSEADPAALLMQTLTAFGNVVGRRPHFIAEGDRHGTNIFPLMVGVSSKARKGSSWAQVKRVFQNLDGKWMSGCVRSGLSSGEGLIWAVRDPIERRDPIKKNGRVIDYQKVIADHGVEDKRLLDLETEFASVLRIIGREGNTLSATMRQAWDTGDMSILNKNSPAKATGAHISIVGHITRDELRRYLDSTEAGNGFANRFLWTCVHRTKLLPEGGRLRDEDLSSIINELQAAVEFARTVREMRRGTKARDLWFEVYPALSEGGRGLLGAVTSRAEAQTMRLACIYALLDRSSFIRVQHLRAALAVWKYCEASARYIFGDSLGDPVADELQEALRNSPKGLTRTDIRDLFGRNRAAHDIDRALSILLECGLVRQERDAPEKGRPSERWFALAVSPSIKAKRDSTR